jgi:hypothetical protein
MGIGTSIALIAAGAILRYAVTATVSGINLTTVGLVLILAGIAGLLISLIWLSAFARRGPVPVAERRTIVRDRDGVDTF